ncbi:MAG TPA: AAA family ATPase [Solirubrobacteraceae bacterium]|jgi:DNA-binding CsgD family transcriptional regulator
MRLLEREEELRRLTGAVEEAAAGRGRMVFVEGAAGIGKTRLLECVREAARERGVDVLSARASELDRDFPFGVVRQLFEGRVSSSPALLRGAAALAEPLVGGAPAPGGDALSDFHGLYWLVANVAEVGPAALVVDDLHWADPRSLRFLRFLLPRLEELPVLVAVAARPGEPGADREALDALAADPATLVVRPEPLSVASVAELAAGALGDAEPSFTDACREATGGNPFLLRELLRELASEGVAPSGDGVEVVRQLAPPTVARAVLVRLGRLGDDAVALARAVAVLGDGTPLSRACAVAGLTASGADVAAALGGADILAPARPLAFAHPVLRAAVYSDVEAGALAALHRRAAEVLAAEGAGADAVAVHLLATEPSADPFVVATLREAAARALARGAAPTAVACLRRALAEPPAADERGDALFELASAEVEAGSPVEAAGHYEEAVRVTSDPRSRALHARERAVALMAAGRGDEAFGLMERAMSEVEDVDPDLALVLEGNLVGIARGQRERIGWARERLERHRGRLTGATRGERLLLGTQAHLDAFSRSCRTPASELADVAERALADDRLVDDALSPPMLFALDVLMLADRIEPARRVLDRAVEDARRRGSAPSFAFSSGMRCGLLARQGDLVSAEADGRGWAEPAFEQGWFLAQPNGLGSLIAVLIDRGELEDAEWVARHTRIADGRPSQSLALSRVMHARARLLAAQGDVGAAREEIGRLGPRRARWNTYPTLVPWVLVAPALAGDDPEQERAEADAMLREARDWGTPRAIGMALHASGLLEGGDRGIELLTEACAVLDDSPAPLEHARALCDLGAALRRSNRRADARLPLRRALDLADACGARPLAERARQELRAAGGRPRRPRMSGVDALTASERRVAELAADGLSNPEIAQALFVTTKTVEGHLGSAYRKLDIRGRAELPRALQA